MNDILDRATHAVRQDGELDAARKRALRQRVLASPKKKSATVVRFVVPVAAVLAAASVWAAASKREVEPSPSRPAPVVTVASVTTAATHEATIATDVPPTPAPPPSAVVAKPKAQAPVVDDSERRALRAYRDAERLQFTDKDWAAALDAWDRYIAVGGKSPLVVDARYDRAVCLVRLGRRDEAREALGPFARGELGAYRQAEAQSLLDGLR